MTSLHDFKATTLEGEQQDLGEYAGKVVLVVNTASHCGLTPQFTGLQQLHQDYSDRGLVVLGFPCGQFANQEKATDDEIGAFCQRNYGVSFPMMSKVDVNGGEAHPVYRWLTKSTRGLLGGRIKWNFTKFLVGPDGQIIKRYSPTTKPEKIAADIEATLPA